MKKVIKQDLTGAKKSAEKKVKYTWKKGEIAWCFCNNYVDIFKVQFTGNRWLSGNKWSWDKIYEFEYLPCPGQSHFAEHLAEGDTISWKEESLFYTTKQEAIIAGLAFIIRKKEIAENAIEQSNKEMARLIKYQNQE